MGRGRGRGVSRLRGALSTTTTRVSHTGHCSHRAGTIWRSVHLAATPSDNAISTACRVRGRGRGRGADAVDRNAEAPLTAGRTPLDHRRQGPCGQVDAPRLPGRTRASAPGGAQARTRPLSLKVGLRWAILLSLLAGDACEKCDPRAPRGALRRRGGRRGVINAGLGPHTRGAWSRTFGFRDTSGCCACVCISRQPVGRR